MTIRTPSISWKQSRCGGQGSIGHMQHGSKLWVQAMGHAAWTHSCGSCRDKQWRMRHVGKRTDLGKDGPVALVLHGAAAIPQLDLDSVHANLSAELLDPDSCCGAILALDNGLLRKSPT